MSKIDKLLQEAISEAKMLRETKENIDIDDLLNEEEGDLLLDDEDFDANNFDEDIDFDFGDIDTSSDFNDFGEDIDFGDFEFGEDFGEDLDFGEFDVFGEEPEDIDIEIDDDILESIDIEDEEEIDDDEIVLEVMLDEDTIDLEDAFSRYGKEIMEEDEYEEKHANLMELLKTTKKELKNSIKVIEGLKHKLEEVNNSRAKLLYMNKLLMENTFTSEEKRKIMESFSKVKSIKEAELLYEALKPAKKDRIMESSASRPVKSTKPLTENIDPAIKRMQELAGIIKN